MYPFPISSSLRLSPRPYSLGPIVCSSRKLKTTTPGVAKQMMRDGGGGLQPSDQATCFTHYDMWQLAGGDEVGPARYCLPRHRGWHVMPATPWEVV